MAPLQLKKKERNRNDSNMQKSYLCNKQTSRALMRTFDCFFPVLQIDDIYAARRVGYASLQPDEAIARRTAAFKLLRSNCCFKSPSCCSARRSPLRGIAAPPSSSGDSAFPITPASQRTGCRCGMWTRPMCAHVCVCVRVETACDKWRGRRQRADITTWNPSLPPGDGDEEIMRSNLAVCASVCELDGGGRVAGGMRGAKQ